MNLAAEMALLPEPKTTKRPPDWAYWRHQLWKLAQTDDPQNFYKWPPIYHCMLVEHWWPKPMNVEDDYVHGKATLAYTFAGMNQPDYHNLVHQLYHILRWQEATGQRIADMRSIYEFGGGYGAMALVCNRLGFRGKYYIYDLPEFALLQQWYLGECGVNNVEWVDGDSYSGVDLMIACYSLSETNFAERDQVLGSIHAGRYLFLYSNKFERYDNIDYFQRSNFWLDRHWSHARIDHLPPESWYTWGW